MKKLMVVAGLLLTVGVASADIADREHDDANTNTVVQAIQTLSERLGVVEDGMNGAEYPQAPTVFRKCRLTKNGIEKCSRTYLKAVN